MFKTSNDNVNGLNSSCRHFAIFLVYLSWTNTVQQHAANKCLKCCSSLALCNAQLQMLDFVKF